MGHDSEISFHFEGYHCHTATDEKTPEVLESDLERCETNLRLVSEFNSKVTSDRIFEALHSMYATRRDSNEGQTRPSSTVNGVSDLVTNDKRSIRMTSECKVATASA